MSAEIDWLRDADVAALQVFIDDNWRPGHVLARDPALLRWQYRYPQRPDLLSVLGASEDGQLVAFLGLVQADFAVDGKRARGAWLAMWHATPEARTRRVGLALLVEALRLPFAAVACLGMNEAAVRIYTGLGFEYVPRLPRWVRPLASEPLAALVPGAETWQAPAPGEVAPEPGAFDDVRAAAWDEVWTTRFVPQLTGTWRDAAYLRSRYLEHPSFDYAVRLSSDGDALLVYRVEQVRYREERVLRVVECLGPAEPLIAAMLDEHPEAAFADFYCMDTTAARALERVGFVREEALPAPVPERFQPLEPPGRGLNGVFRIPLSGRSLYCTKSDGDQDRPG